ncbi:Glu/Leu/Phe/Val family dehydrogenase [Aliiruegeria lutimaris]|uniref:Glutamate dehydrogenase n=1 Tax=Aliiruegeria lutimaris TaxID=571298 RepID=A0A1G8YKM6_9RHOB|nr:Glu/Leu/Phe/Val dehydrogenase [Aliiruegeria lutimaris]SDK03233.1 glutamate dehydrogenase (NAD(P)+) [Aliiruegeria lutimaris]
MTSPFALTDSFGPEKIVHLSNPAARLKAIVVIDNTALGAGIGGTRMAPDVTLEECARLARAMTLKNALAGLPHGGAKSVICADPSMPLADKERLIRAFARAISTLDGYVPGPDMGTDETCMAWIKDETGRAVGLPRLLGGIPLDEIGATGFGVAEALDAAAPFSGIVSDGARVAIQGFGAVGRHAALILAKRGARIVAVSDSGGCVSDPDGLSLDKLLEIKAAGGSVTDLENVATAARDDVIGIDCDILVPAARPDVIHSDNVDAVRARVIVEGANIPATIEAETDLHRRGILVIPDFVANAGGVICASIEARGGTEGQVLGVISELIRRNTTEVLQRVGQSGDLPRDVARRLAETRVRGAMDLRRSF